MPNIPRSILTVRTEPSKAFNYSSETILNFECLLPEEFVDVVKLERNGWLKLKKVIAEAVATFHPDRVPFTQEDEDFYKQ